jgi:predicted transcriptional regulator
MNEEVLREIGFSMNEAKVYIALLELGSSTAGGIAKKSKVHRTNVYDALEGLTKKGAAAHFLKNGVKYYEATDPDNLMNLLKEKEWALQSIMPQLKLMHQFVNIKTDAYVYEGIKPVKEILNEFLNKKEPIMVFGVPSHAPEKFEPFLSLYHKKRANAKIPMRHIYNFGGQERVKELNKMKYTEARYFPKEFVTPASTHVCGDEVVFIIWEDPILVIQIKNQDMADSYKKYFELLWSMSKKD